MAFPLTAICLGLSLVKWHQEQFGDLFFISNLLQTFCERTLQALSEKQLQIYWILLPRLP
jgi:hypothetical protein